MQRARPGFAFLFLGAVQLSLGCAAERDARSRELVALTHLATAPIGQLSAADDRTYSFTDWERNAVSSGKLSEADFQELETHLSDSALAPLYAAREEDSERCKNDGDGYVVTTSRGTACFVLATIRDPSARASLEFLSGLFRRAASQR
jgi:hypothetical protein